jgi:hypothetical protein
MKPRRLAPVALIVLVLSASRLAIADPPSLSDSLTGAAKEAFVSAEILLHNDDFAGALTKYEQAYGASKDPRLLFNMAICARSLKQYARMQSLLTRYEREGGETISSDDRANVERALAAIHNLTGALRLSAAEPGATITIDGQPSGMTPLHESITLDLGHHKVAVAKDGFEPFEQVVTVQGGEVVALNVALVAVQHTAQLVVSADAEATIVVDGVTVAKGQFHGRLTTGLHAVQVAAPGRLTYKSQIELLDGETRTVDVTLQEEKHGAPVWPWAVGVAIVGLAAGLTVGGYFLFRSPEETQAQFQGSLGSVRLTSW